MSKVQSPESKVEEKVSDELPFVNGELVETSPDEEVVTILKTKNRKRLSIPTAEDQKPKTENQKYFLQYIILPLIFLTAALLGGLRISAVNATFLFLKPPLVCLIFAVILLVLFFRANLIRLNGWFSENSDAHISSYHHLGRSNCAAGVGYGSGLTRQIDFLNT